MADSMKELLLKISGDISGLKTALGQGKSELSGFTTHAKEAGSQVKDALALAGVAIGLGILVNKLREAATEFATIGARTETLGVAMNAVGKNLGMSAGSLDYFVQETKKAGVTTQESMTAVTKFLMQGLPLTQLKELATRARDLAVIAGKNTSETLAGVVHGIVTQQTEVLRTYGVNVGNFEEINKRYAQSIGKTKEQLNSVEKAQNALNLVLEKTQFVSGAAAAADATVGKQLASLARYAEQAKESFFSFFGPIMVAAIQATTENWKELERWAVQNKDTLREWGTWIAQWVTWAMSAGKQAILWAYNNRELLATILEFAVLLKVAGWVQTLGVALGAAYTGAMALSSGAQTLSMAFGGWLGVLIKVLAVLMAIWALKVPPMIQKESELSTKGGGKGIGPTGMAMALGEAAYLDNFQQITDEQAAMARGAQAEAVKKGPQITKPGFGNEGYVAQVEMWTKHFEKEGMTTEAARAKAADALSKVAVEEAQGAGKKAMDEAAKTAGKGKEAKGKADKDYTSSLLGEISAQRKAQIAAAKAELDLFNATSETKKTKLQADYASQKITAAEYYKSIEDLEKAGLAKQIQILQTQIDAENEAYKKWKATIEGSSAEPEKKTADLARLESDHKARSLELENKIAIAKEKNLTLEQKKNLEGAQAKLRMEDLLTQEESAAAFTEGEKKEARINALLEDQKKKRIELQDLIQKQVQGGQMTPAEGEDKLKKFDQLSWRQQQIAMYGEEAVRWSESISSGIDSLVNSLMDGGKDLTTALKGFFQKMFKDSLVPGFKQLKDYLASTMKDIMGSTGESLFNGIMGVVGIVGMLALSKGKSSFSASGVQSQVTASEPVRGIIAGEESVPIAKVNLGLKEALVETNAILRSIEGILSGGAAMPTTSQTVTRSNLEAYFGTVLQTQPS